MFDAVFFDLDGTLVDTESAAMAAGLRAFAQLGHPVDAAFMHGLVGKTKAQSDGLITAHRPGVDLAALERLWAAEAQATEAAGLVLKPGAAELLQALSFPAALVTSSGRDSAHHKLTRTGLHPHFRTIVTFDDVVRPKPAPEPYLLAAQRLGVQPARCVVFEDSDTGAEAAHRAGCIVVQVPDVAPTDGRFAHHLCATLLDGARAAGLI